MTKLAIILCGRNDNHGGAFIDRLKNSLQWNSHLSEKYQVPTEIFFVEYNPPADQPKLGEMDIWPKHKYWETHLIEHQDNSGDFVEFKAKNIALTTVNDDHWVLVTNADILLPESLFANLNRLNNNAFFLAKRLNTRVIARSWQTMMKSVDQYCVKDKIYHRPKFVPHGFYFRLLMVYAKVRLRFYSMSPIILKPGISILIKYQFAACGDFMLAKGELWKKIGFYRENTLSNMHVDSLFLVKVISHEIEINEISDPILHQHHEHNYNFKKPTESMNKMWQELIQALEYVEKTGQILKN